MCNETTESASSAVAEEDEEECLEGVGKMIQDLFRFGSSDAALDALNLDLDTDKKKCERLVTAGGCFALVHMTKNCLDKAIDMAIGNHWVCDQVTTFYPLAELTTLNKTLHVIINLISHH
jgi:hypothetical protein